MKKQQKSSTQDLLGEGMAENVGEGVPPSLEPFPVFLDFLLLSSLLPLLFFDLLILLLTLLPLLLLLPRLPPFPFPFPFMLILMLEYIFAYMASKARLSSASNRSLSAWVVATSSCSFPVTTEQPNSESKRIAIVAIGDRIIHSEIIGTTPIVQTIATRVVPVSKKVVSHQQVLRYVLSSLSFQESNYASPDRSGILDSLLEIPQSLALRVQRLLPQIVGSLWCTPKL